MSSQALTRACLTVLLVALYLLDLGSVGFLGPDEPRYASIGREMARSGDWVTPRLNGSPWFEKPPLIYWTTAAANRLGLRDEWAARLPVALISLAFLTFFFTALRHEFSLRVATTATVILGCSAGWLGASFAAVPDLPMTAALTAAMMVALFDTRPHSGWISGALVGLAILAKGFLPAALFAPAWLIARGKRVESLAAAIVVAAPWYLLCLMRNGSAFWNEFFWKHHVERLVSADALQHGQPFWYYVPVLLAGLFPWTPLAGLLARRKSYGDARLRFWLIWLIGVLIFFSIVPNKLPLYVLPLMPALAMVLAVALDQVAGAEWWIAACVALTLFLPTIADALPQVFLTGATKAHWSFNPVGLIAIAVAVGVWWLARRGRMMEGVIVAGMVVAMGAAYIKLTAFPLLEQRDSVRSFWRAHEAQAASACVDASVSRSWQYGLEYYAGRGLPECGASGAESWRIRQKDGALQ